MLGQQAAWPCPGALPASERSSAASPSFPAGCAEQHPTEPRRSPSAEGNLLPPPSHSHTNSLPSSPDPSVQGSIWTPSHVCQGSKWQAQLACLPSERALSFGGLSAPLLHMHTVSYFRCCTVGVKAVPPLQEPYGSYYRCRETEKNVCIYLYMCRHIYMCM